MATDSHTLRGSEINAAKIVLAACTDTSIFGGLISAQSGMTPQSQAMVNTNPRELNENNQTLFGTPAMATWAASLHLAPGATVRDLYCSVAASPAFRIACGRISASSAW